MSIQKKSLISTLKTTKKANVAKEELEGVTSASVKSPARVLGTKAPARVLGTKAPARVLGTKAPARMLSSKTGGR